MAYAENTSVTPERSRMEIEQTLTRYGASSFMYGWDQDRAVVQFQASGRHVRFVLPMPDAADFPNARAGNGRVVKGEARFEQATRQRWRALALVIKAKLEAVDAGIVTFEEEFMAHVVLPDGSTVGQFMGPQIENAYANGAMPAMLALGSGAKPRK